MIEFRWLVKTKSASLYGFHKYNTLQFRTVVSEAFGYATPDGRRHVHQTEWSNWQDVPVVEDTKADYREECV